MAAAGTGGGQAASGQNGTSAAGSNGWTLEVPLSGPGGDWSDLRALSTLPPALTFCPCSMSDTVLVFADLTGGHNTPVDNFAASPWIDLKAGGDVGRPGRILLFDGYFALPLTNYIYTQTLASWYPAVCPNTGKLYTHPFITVPEFGFVGNPGGCTAPGAPQYKEMSGLIPPSAEQVRVGACRSRSGRRACCSSSRSACVACRRRSRWRRRT